MLRVWSPAGTELAAVDEVEDVGALKLHLRECHGFPVSMQSLLLEGSCLEDSSKLESGDLQLVLGPPSGALSRQVAELVDCSEVGDIEPVRHLLGSGLDADVTYNGWSPLTSAAFQGHAELVQVLLAAGAAVDYREGCHGTPLVHACRGSSVEVVKLLIDARASTEQAIVAAAAKGYGKILRLLVDAKGNVNERSVLGWSALTLACDRGETDMIGLLLELGADKERRDGLSRTALLCACGKGHAEAARRLLEARASTSYTPSRWPMEGSTPLTLAAHEGHIDVVRLLLEARVNAKQPNRDGRSPVACAAERGHEEILRLLEA